jgi:hypothetical protein
MPGRSADILGSPNLKNDNNWIHQDYMRCAGQALSDPFNAGNHRKAERLPDALADGYQVQPVMELVDGAPCVVAAHPTRGKVWLDPTLGYALRLREVRDGASGVLSWRVHNSDFAEVLPGLWLPKVCRREVCGPPLASAPYAGKPLLRYTYTVTRLTVNDVPDALFTLDIEPGLRVMDATVLPPQDGENQLVTYIMPADPSMIDQAIQDALAKRTLLGGGRRWLTWFAWANVAVLSGLVLFVGYRWTMRRRAARADA